ncbi:extracellular solute-binding protein [Paenibacillus rigui]|uniref:ABC transporter substrate-binding protein n=1 Tax=Paenibacillus rigui TaxID=554312 RepID=A0A229UQM3_9BACL|nr:extracellular solute-binding protein [Paenibacillus rigui]OXM85571.1 ABC transporter substrate-binding protein [Paenibacillus rigui]
MSGGNKREKDSFLPSKQETLKKRYRKGKAGAALLVFPVLLTACGGGQQAQQTGKSVQTAVDQTPLNISIMTITPSAPPAADDNVIKRAIEKATNSKLNIQWVSNNIYKDKLNLTLASGQIPDLTFISDPFSSSFRSLVTQGVFWDISPYIKDYPNLQKGIPSIAWELTKLDDGKNYGIPRARDENDESFFIVRKDWLDKLGLKPPTTTDELYQVMKAFVEKDPDGNGKNDTVALAASITPDDASNWGGIGPVLGTIESAFTGVNGKWKLDGDKLVYTALLPEVRNALEYNARAYKEKLLPEDLLSLKTTQIRDLFKGNKAGIVVDKTGTGNRVYTTDLRKLVPDFKDTQFFPLTSLNGYTPKGTGFNGILAIPKSVPEAKMKRILQLVDQWTSPEVSGIQRFGFEGVHYKLENGLKIVNPDKLNADNASDFNQIVNSIDPSLDQIPATEDLKAADEQKKKVQAERSKISKADISVGLNSPTAQKISPQLDKKIQDLKSKIIIGREPITAWDDFVAKLKTDPDLIKMTEEMTQAYHKREGK